METPNPTASHAVPLAVSASALRREVATRLALASVVVWIAWRGGTYATSAWAVLGAAVWWTVALGLVLGLWRFQPKHGPAWLVAALLVGFAGWTTLSATWAADAGTAFSAGGRAIVYAGVLVLTVLAAPRASAARCSDGIAFGIAAVTVLALASRLFPGHLGGGTTLEFLPEAANRLAYPVDYWNGLAILVAISCPLLLRIAAGETSTVARGLAIAPFPAIAVTIYFASSRTGAIVALLGLAAFVALSGRRWTAGAAAVIGLAASIAAVSYVSRFAQLVDGPLDAPQVVGQGRHAAVAILLAGVAAAIVYAAWGPYLDKPRLPRGSGWAAVATSLVLVVAVIAAADPVHRWEEFTEAPTSESRSSLSSHFLSSNGNYRWQYWNATVNQFRDHPLAGEGAGSFEAWWASRGDVFGFVQNAHSLYLETLGSLGLVGLLLIASAFGGGALLAIRRALRAPPRLREPAAAIAAAFVAYGVAVGFDWMWELPVVSIVGALLLGLALGPAAAPSENTARRDTGELLPHFVLTPVALVALAGLLAIFAADMKVADSRDAAARGDYEEAENAALTAQRLQPWSSVPRVQLALVNELAGRLRSAEERIIEAVERDRDDWRVWLVYARIETKLGRIRVARAALHRSQSLSPRSSVFATFPAVPNE